MTFDTGFMRQKDSAKFLRLVIDERLKFKKHVNTIFSNVSRTCGILYYLNDTFSYEQLKILHLTLILPHLSYCIKAWYGAPQCKLDIILILQKKTIRNIHNLPLNHHLLRLFKSAEVLKLPELNSHKQGFHMYKLATNHDQFILPKSHRYDTRNENSLPNPQVNLSTSHLSWHYRGISLWNYLPTDLRKSKKLFVFKTILRFFPVVTI